MGRSRALRSLPVVVLLMLACDAGSNAPGPQRPNIVLVTIDTLRADHLAAYGYSRETMPNLSTWLHEAAVFEDAYSPIPLTDPSLASIMTALHPTRHGVRHSNRELAPEFTTLAQLLQARGYATAAFVSRNGLLRPKSLRRGFDVANFVGGEHEGLTGPRAAAELWQRRAPSVTTSALEWLEAPPPRPFFLWLHYYDPHAYYDPRAPFRDAFSAELDPQPVEDMRAWWGRPRDLGIMVALYDSEILTVDHHLARIVEALKRQGIWDSTLFVLTSDHGESLGEHGHLDHGEWLYQEQVRVPLLFRFPGRVAPNVRIPDLVRLFDIAPTLLELIGARGPDVDDFVSGMDGVSLAPLFAGGRVAPQRIFLESENCPNPKQVNLAPGMVCDPPGIEGKVRAVFDGRYKLIVTPRVDGRATELYDLEHDPAETDDLSERQPQRVAELSAAIEAYWAGHAAGAVVDEEMAERLRALGYTD
jgi:arylsulfatase A-like enzyme